ncbi:MAG TPA: hypothetical protein VNH11_26535 [Pirellulales bacterium]|nr:hypothetical protein [Pirellulales bacterium]
MNRLFVPVVVLAFVCCCVSPAFANIVHEGKLVSVDDEDHKIVVLIKGSDEREFKVDEKCEVMLDGKKADLEDLEEGASVRLMTKKVKGAEVVVKIEAKSAE